MLLPLRRRVEEPMTLILGGVSKESRTKVYKKNLLWYPTTSATALSRSFFQGQISKIGIDKKLK